MFSQIADSLYYIDVFSKILVFSNAIFWVAFSVFLLSFCINLNQRLWERKSQEECDATRKKVFPWMVSCFILAFSASICAMLLPSKEIAVMRAIAPTVDKYIEKNPDSILNPEGLLSVVDKVADKSGELADALINKAVDSLGVKESNKEEEKK